MSVRRQVELRSGPVLVVLGQQPRWLVALAVVLLFAGLLALPLVPGALCLVLLLAGLGWLSYLSWPGLDGRARVLRAVVLAGLLVLGVAQLG